MVSLYKARLRCITPLSKYGDGFSKYWSNKEIIKYNLRLDAVAVHVLLYTVCCNHRKVQCLFVAGSSLNTWILLRRLWS